MTRYEYNTRESHRSRSMSAPPKVKVSFGYEIEVRFGVGSSGRNSGDSSPFGLNSVGELSLGRPLRLSRRKLTDMDDESCIIIFLIRPNELPAIFGMVTLLPWYLKQHPVMFTQHSDLLNNSKVV